MSKPLECSVFSGNNPLTGEVIWDHRVNGGSEAIKDKLKSLYNWDGSSSVASVAAKLDADIVGQLSAASTAPFGDMCWRLFQRFQRVLCDHQR